MGYGNLLYQEGSSAEAATRFREVIKYHSNFAPAWNNLAQILLEGGDVAQARTAADRAIELGGPFVDIYRETLAKIEAAK